MELYTKKEIAEMSLRPFIIDETTAKVAKKYINILFEKTPKGFILKIRSMTKLNVCLFSDDLYYIRN